VSAPEIRSWPKCALNAVGRSLLLALAVLAVTGLLISCSSYVVGARIGAIGDRPQLQVVYAKPSLISLARGIRVGEMSIDNDSVVGSHQSLELLRTNLALGDRRRKIVFCGWEWRQCMLWPVKSARLSQGIISYLHTLVELYITSRGFPIVGVVPRPCHVSFWFGASGRSPEFWATNVITQPDIGPLVLGEVLAGVPYHDSIQYGQYQGDPCVNGKDNKGEFLKAVFSFCLGCICFTFGIVLLNKTWRPCNFDLSSNVNVVGRVLLSVVLIWIGMGLFFMALFISFVPST